MENEDVKKLKEQAKKLEETLKYHAKKYYEENTNEISDYEYDKLNSSLKQIYEKHPELRPKDSITNKVGGDINSSFEKVEHKVPLLSLMDIFSYEEVKDFYDKIKKQAKINDIKDLKFVVETKIDGLSAAIKFVDGKYIQGATRGNGRIGEDVTKNIETIKTMPKQINHDGELTLRGEVFIDKKTFEELNKKQKEENKEEFANARNAAARSLRQLDFSIAKNRNLDMYIFNVQEDTKNMFDSHSEYLKYLEDLGFNVIPYKYVCRTYEEIIAAIEKIHNLREDLGFGIDGAVIKVDDLRFRKILGENVKTPKWAIAYKYPPEQKETKVLDIVFTIGRTGVITPNAILEPVKVDGSVISKVSLHSKNIMEQKDIKKGDIVKIHKAGDVIPEITQVVKEKRTGNEEKISMPENCPVCGAKVHIEENGQIARCTSLECPAKITRSIEHFVSRNAMNIEGLGEAIVAVLLKSNVITDISDLYKLTKEDLFKLDIQKKFKEKSANNLLQSIEKSKTRNLNNLINALGINGVGDGLSIILAKKFKTMEKLENATLEELENINDIGKKTAKDIYDFFKLPQNIELIEKLKNYGLNMNYIAQDIQNDNLENLTFVVTGKFDDLKRGELINLIEQNGGKVASGVTKKTSYLVAGQDARSKLEKAEKLKIPIIGLDELDKLIKDGKDGNNI